MAEEVPRGRSGHGFAGTADVPARACSATQARRRGDRRHRADQGSLATLSIGRRRSSTSRSCRWWYASSGTRRSRGRPPSITCQIGVLFSVFVALISLLLVGRHTRGDEEAGRAELVLSTATGRYAPTTAALLVVAGADLLIAAGVSLGLLAYGLPVAGSLALGVWFGAVGLIFAAVAAVSAQLSPNARTASGIALAVLGASYGLRAGGDAGADALSWLSPIGWAQQTRSFAD